MNPSPESKRPKSKSLVRLDLYNAYARLGASPLLSTEEIKALVQRKRKELMRKRRTRGQQQFGEEEAEITELQEIENEIGTPKARACYDRENPQNELLTIQPSPHDRWLDPKHRARLVTAWLVEELGRDALLPSPDCLPLWAPGGIDDDLAVFLAEFSAEPARSGSEDREPATVADDAPLAPGIDAIRRLLSAGSRDEETLPSPDDVTARKDAHDG
jgi:hypothetical protein